MDRPHGNPQLWSWHHTCGHDCRDGLGCNVAEHYLACTCLAIRERHVADADRALTAPAAAVERRPSR